MENKDNLRDQKTEHQYNISQQIIVFFLGIVAVFTVIFLVILFFSNKSEKKLSQTYEKGKVFYEDFAALDNLLASQNDDLSKVVYFKYSKEPIKRIKNRYRFEWPTMKNKLVNLVDQEQYQELKPQMLELVSEIDTLFEIQMVQFWSPLLSLKPDKDVYEYDRIRLSYEFYLVSRHELVKEKLDKMNAEFKEEYFVVFEDLFESSEKQRIIALIGFILIAALSIMAVIYLQNSINRPLNFLIQLISSITQGKLPTTGFKLLNKNHDLAQISERMFQYIDRLKQTVEFIEKVGEGDHDFEYEALGEEDKLGNTLLTMRKELKKIADEESIRSWTTENLRKFDEVLRLNNNDAKALSSELIKLFVKSTNGQVGNFFVKEYEEETKLDCMILKSCYAFNREKNRSMARYEGDGLLGQAWKDNEIICIDDLPPDYLEIESGIGKAEPISIMIVPLSFSNVVYGMVEVASFEVFKPHIIAFAKQAATIVGSTLSNVINNQENRKLGSMYRDMEKRIAGLEYAKSQALEKYEESQSEVVRFQSEIDDFNNIINGLFAKAVFDKDGVLLSVNETYEDMFGFIIQDIMGKHHSTSVNKNYRNSEEYIDFWNRIHRGVTIYKKENWITKEQNEMEVQAFYYPILDSERKFSKLITFLTTENLAVTEKDLTSISHN